MIKIRMSELIGFNDAEIIEFEESEDTENDNKQD